MRMSHLFSQTLREPPSEAEIASHQLLLRAGFIRQLAAGVFSYLPLARRSLSKIEAILRQEIEAIGGQEVTMPVVHPADLWKESGRYYKIDAEMGRFKDRANRDLVLAMTHEEVVADLVRREIHSYRQLPQLIYHIQTKWRDDPRPRAGLIRVREFTMKDSYSLDADWDGLDRQYRAHYQAYFNIFRRCNLPVIAVASDVGMMGGQMAHEFMYLTPVGEDTIMICDACGHSANRQVARFRKPTLPAEPPLPIEKVATPHTKTIEDLAQYLNVPAAKTAKAVFLMATIDADNPESQPETKGDTAVINPFNPLQKSADSPPADSNTLQPPNQRFLFVVIRGDMEVNETKLLNALSARELRPATEEEIRAVGAEPGYASPVGLEREKSQLPLLVVVDDAIPASPNLVAGANEEGYHLRHTNYGRDYLADLMVDIAAAQEGDACPECGQPLRAARGVETGNIFKLGTRYSEALGCFYADSEGQSRPVVMGSYGIGSGRLLACIAEEHHDEYGLKWPITVAPFQVHLVVLSGKGKKSTTTTTDYADYADCAERLYQELQAAGVEVLLDDRDESPGVKFNDADLIGLPLRLTVSERALKQGGYEFKRRDRPDKIIIPQEEVVARVQAEIAALQADIQSRVTPIEYVA